MNPARTIEFIFGVIIIFLGLTTLFHNYYLEVSEFDVIFLLIIFAIGIYIIWDSFKKDKKIKRKKK